MVEHDEEVKWRQKIVPVKDLKPWRLEWSGVIYRATGPCPVCHAPGQSGSTYSQGVYDNGLGAGDAADGDAAGDLLAPAAEGDDSAGPDLSVEIDVDCRCDAAHGEGKVGCGAQWVVRVKDLV